MNAKKARQLRKEVLGDYSVKYRTYETGLGGSRVDTGPHGTYRRAKKAAQKARRQP